MITVLMLVGGLIALTVGAELLVRGAASLAAAAKVSPLVIGLTVVAFGTSAPELVVSIQTSLRGQDDIALGNVVGSNIFNVLFILGASALITPLRVQQQLVRFEVPLMIALSVLVGVLGWDGRLGRLEGGMLTAGLIAYTLWGIIQSRREQMAIQEEYAAEFGDGQQNTLAKLLFDVVLVAAGLALLVGGARAFTDGAVGIARYVGISELVIGLTIVSIGTSLPEVATSIVAAIRGESDIAVGNVVGSNIFNIMGVLGVAGIVAPNGVAVHESALYFDIPVMIAVAVACMPVFCTWHTIFRWEGGLFLAYYFIYTTYLILAETNSSITKAYGNVVLGFVLPLTVITFAISLYRAFFAKKEPAM